MVSVSKKNNYKSVIKKIGMDMSMVRARLFIFFDVLFLFKSESFMFILSYEELAQDISQKCQTGKCGSWLV